MTADCRVCQAGPLEPYLAIDRAPANISRLLPAEERGTDRAVSLDVRRCAACGLVQLVDLLPATYYDDYVMTVSHADTMRRYQEDQAAAFVDRFALAGRDVVEVGCGDGHYLALLAGRGARAVGIEPSAAFRRLAEATGLPVRGGYVGAGRPLPDGPFDAFATRQVLEHVPDPVDFLATIRASLRPGGIGLVEVPSLEQALEHGRFFDFFPDHLNYFSVSTLSGTLERAGFLVREVTRGMNGEYLQAIVVDGGGRDRAALARASRDVVEGFRRLVGSCVADGERLAVWGAGAKGLALLAAADTAGIALLVDSDPHKQGRYTPVSGLLVEPVEALAAGRADVVLVTAMAYHDEIVRDLRDRIGFRGRVVALDRALGTAA